MRLIDADKFNSFDYDDDRGNEFDSPTEAYIQGVEYVLNEIDKSPTIDAVAVVRCKDCEFCHHYYDWANFDRYRCYAKYDTSVGCKSFTDIRIDVQADDYCSRGRRKV